MINLEKRSAMLTKSESKYCAAKMEEAWQRWKEFEFFLKADKLVGEMMDMLGIRHEFFMLGGSVAMIGYGILLNRVPHDIDVIVPNDVFNIFVEIIENSRLFERTRGSMYGIGPVASYFVKDKEGNRVVVDILGSPIGIPSRFKQYRHDHCYLQDLKEIKAVKEKWNRPKDRCDIEKINKFLEPQLVCDINKELDNLIVPPPAPVSINQDDDDLPF